MKHETLTRAVRDALRFVDAARAVQEAEAHPKTYTWGEGNSTTFVPRGGVLNATCRRASMDLSRTLADLRANR